MTELERALVSLGRELDVPEAPDAVTAVLARLEPRREGRTLLAPRRLALAVALVLLAALLATLAIPDARSALFRALHIGGASIEVGDELPEVPAEPDLELTLGQRVTLAEATRDAGFDVRRLDEEPDAVYLGDRGTVWLLYGSPQRPRLLLAQTPFHSVDQELLLKKVAAAGTTVELVAVDGARGAFLSGDPHFLFLLDELGNPVEDSARLAGNVLLWSEGRIAYRLEGDVDRETALELAESLR
jgi:hypothetical protein